MHSIMFEIGPWEVRRREPCFACGLPVFLAQRLLIGGHLYHRTCFRCARCSTQLTLADCYETQDGSYCCETCPDEEMVPQEIGDKGGGLEPPPSTPPPADKTDPLVTSRTTNLVLLRRMMFENIADDSVKQKSASSQRSSFRRPSDLEECDVVIDEQPNTECISDKTVGVVNNSRNRLSFKNDFVKNTGDISDSRDIDNDFISNTHSTRDSFRRTLDGAPKHVDDVSTDQNDKDEYSSLIVAMVPDVVEAENISVSAQSRLDVDSDLEPNSCSSDVSLVQTKNHTMKSDIDAVIEYKELVESKESLETKLVEAKNDVVVQESDMEETKSENSEMEVLLSRADSESVNQQVDHEGDEVENKDEFSSLTHNIEQLVIEARNEELVKNESQKVESLNEKEDKKVLTLEKDDPGEIKPPTPMARVIKHKPPTPHVRKGKKSLDAKEKDKKVLIEYPDHLNPFGDEEEEEHVHEKSSSSLNPFGSDDEDEELSKTSLVSQSEIPTPAVRKVVPAPKVSLNPFWSGDEEEEEEISLTPVPKPRKLSSGTISRSPEPRRLRSATGSLGSSTSIASRKKKPAPPPPNWQSTTGRKSLTAPRPPPAPRTVTPSPPPLPVSSPPSSPRPASPHTLDKDESLMFRPRQNSIVSETSSVGTISSYTPHKSMYGQWKRKKGPAPARPVPVRRSVAPMPLTAVRQELADIEVKQQGLERQGVKLEETIRDKFEQEGTSLTPYVEEMVLQLFELVNEKNELFRRQAELMYLRRQHNLEEEHAELEYQIRCLMLCPERNKTDSDKAREEQLIQRLVEVVERRNEIIDCLEMDRLREQEEDRSVGTQLGIFSAAVGNDLDLRVKTDKDKDKKGKKSKKEKRWSRREADKEVDESGEKKKHKKKWFPLPLHHSSKS